MEKRDEVMIGLHLHETADRVLPFMSLRAVAQRCGVWWRVFTTPCLRRLTLNALHLPNGPKRHHWKERAGVGSVPCPSRVLALVVLVAMLQPIVVSLVGCDSPNTFASNQHPNPNMKLMPPSAATDVVSEQNVDVGDILRGVLTCVRRHSVRVDVEYATLILNILCLDSIGKVIERHCCGSDGTAG